MMNGKTYGKLLLNIPVKDLDVMDALVMAGEFTTRSDLIRFAIKRVLYSEERMKEFDRISAKLQKQTKRMGLSRKDVLKEVEDARRMSRKEDDMRRFDEAARAVGDRVRIGERGLTRKDIARMIEEVKDETRKEVRQMLKDVEKKNKKEKKAARKTGKRR